MDAVTDIGQRLEQIKTDLLNSGALTNEQRLELLNLTYDLSALEAAFCAHKKNSTFSGTAVMLMRESRTEIEKLSGSANAGKIILEFDLGLDDEDGEESEDVTES